MTPDHVDPLETCECSRLEQGEFDEAEKLTEQIVECDFSSRDTEGPSEARWDAKLLSLSIQGVCLGTVYSPCELDGFGPNVCPAAPQSGRCYATSHSIIASLDSQVFLDERLHRTIGNGYLD